MGVFDDFRFQNVDKVSSSKFQVSSKSEIQMAKELIEQPATDCAGIREFLEKRTNFEVQFPEVDRHFEVCPDCRNMANENMRLKEGLKRAFRKEEVPADLLKLIREKIDDEGS